MMASAEWERQTVRERSIAGQLRVWAIGKLIGRGQVLKESVKTDIRLPHQPGCSATRPAEAYRVGCSTVYKAIVITGILAADFDAAVDIVRLMPEVLEI